MAFTDDYLHQPPAVENAMGTQLTALLRQFEAACTAAGRGGDRPVEQHPDAKIITRFPGLGKLAGTRVLAEIGDDRARFAEARGLKDFAGSAPSPAPGARKPLCGTPPYQKPALFAVVRRGQEGQRTWMVPKVFPSGMKTAPYVCPPSAIFRP